MGRKIDSYRYPILENEIDLKDEGAFRAFWRKHVVQLSKRDKELRDAINWDSYPPLRHMVGGDGEPAYQSGWAAFGNPNYLNVCFWKTRDDIVYISGMCKKTGVGASIFILPLGYRPINGHVFLCEAAATTGQPNARVDALASGHVFYQSGGSPSIRLSLAGIIFPAEEL